MKSVVDKNTIVAKFDLLPALIRDHLSFSKTDSIALSCGDISGLIISGEGKELLFAKIIFTSMVRWSLIKMGRGLD